MFFISLYSIFNSIDNTLESLSPSYINSPIDNFMNELISYLNKTSPILELEHLPKDTLFTIDRYEGNYAVCENRTNGEMYDIPKSKVISTAKEGDILKLEDGIYVVQHEETNKQRQLMRDLMNEINKKMKK